MTLNEALLLLPNGAAANKCSFIFEANGDTPFYKFIFKNQWKFDSVVLPILKVKLNVLKKKRGKEKRLPILIYDNRFLKIVKSEWPEVCLILDSKGCLVKKGGFELCTEFSSSSSVPNLPREENLHILLGLKARFKNPTNFAETKKILQKYKMHNSTIVWYHWRITKNVDRFGEIWHQPPNNKNYNLDVEAFLKPDYSVGFRASTRYLFDLKHPKNPFLLDNPESKTSEAAEEDSSPDEFQRNSCSSVSVSPQGMNELLNISDISEQEFRETSFSLGETVAVLWLELDTENAARFASYRDSEIIYQIELCSQADWKKLFDFIFWKREIIEKKKELILNKNLAYLQSFPPDVNSRFTKCLRNLRGFIRNSKLLVYSKSDHAMHSLKLQFGNYMFNRQKKYFRGVEMNSDSRNNLSMLKTAEMTIFNFRNYMELEEDKKDEDVSSIPIILVLPKYLRNQKLQPQHNGMSTIEYVRKRGRVKSDNLLEAYKNFGSMFIEQFKFDIFSLPLMSLSALSFRAVWTFYARSGGLYHHSLEKPKDFDRQLLRLQCKGGFSYSAKLKRDAGDFLNSNSNERCSNIQGCDIRSSYGFACSELSAVKGFCNSYKSTGENNILIGCDPSKRFKSFEFLSVFYTIHFLETQLKLNIKTVYSNFSQFGIFCLKHYPLDLAIVTTEGKLMLFNMDGGYAHGCRNGCPDLKSYIRNKSRLELESDSQKRDDFINDWCKAINSRANDQSLCTYLVKTDCHDNSYTRKNLMSNFYTFPILNALISNYFSSKEITLDELLMCSDDLTFLCLAEGFVPKIGPKPLLVLDSRNNNWNRSGSTKEPLFLTRDYISWITRVFNFRVKKVHKVWIYKKCKVFNKIFKDLTDKRAAPSCSSSQKQFLKDVVNFCSGYLGMNEQKNKTFTTVRLVTKLTRHVNYQNTEIVPLGSVGTLNFLMLRKTVENKRKLYSGSSPLPLYCLITEYGKLRLSQVMCFFETFLVPEKLIFVYSHIDNLIFIISTDTIEEAVVPGLEKKFSFLKSLLFGDKPGQLKEEFQFVISDSWKFVSGMPQNYAILSPDNAGIHKNNGLNCISSERSYQASCAILAKSKFVIQQERRVDKMRNTETVCKNICFGNNNNCE